MLTVVPATTATSLIVKLRNVVSTMSMEQPLAEIHSVFPFERVFSNVVFEILTIQLLVGEVRDVSLSTLTLVKRTFFNSTWSMKLINAVTRSEKRSSARARTLKVEVGNLRVVNRYSA